MHPREREARDLAAFGVGLIVGSVIAFAVGFACGMRHADAQAEIESACHPGAYVQTLADGSALCSGGSGELWAVKP